MANIDDIISKVNDIGQSILESPLKDNSVEHYNKITALLGIIDKRIKQQSDLLYNTSILNNIDTQLNQLSSYIQQYNSSNSSAYLTYIDNTINQLFPSIASIPVFMKGETQPILNKILTDFENSNIHILQNLKDENFKLSTKIQELENKLSSISTKLDNKNTELDNISSNFQQQFSTAQEKRLNDFADKLKDFEKRFEEQRNEQSNNYSTTFDNLKSSAESKLQTINEIKDKIEKIYSIVGQESIVGSQKMYADKAKDFANKLFFASISLMLMFAIVVIWPAIEAICNSIFAFDPTRTFSNLNWNILLCRLPIAALLLLPAVYMANESKKQRDKENKYRELEIKMAAIEPYFNNICEKCKDANTQLPEKDAVKLELAKQLLIPTPTSSDKNVIIPTDVSELIENILKAVCKK